MSNEAHHVVSHVVPPRRTKELVVRTQGEGTLILDRRTDAAHYLPAEVTRVWGACTGRTTLAEVASVSGIDEQIAASAVDQLLELDLLEAPAGIDRRRFLRRSALVGAGALTASTIYTVVAPLPQAAATGGPPFGPEDFATRTLVCNVGPGTAPPQFTFAITMQPAVNFQQTFTFTGTFSGLSATGQPVTGTLTPGTLTLLAFNTETTASPLETLTGVHLTPPCQNPIVTLTFANVNNPSATTTFSVPLPCGCTGTLAAPLSSSSTATTPTNTAPRTPAVQGPSSTPSSTPPSTTPTPSSTPPSSTPSSTPPSSTPPPSSSSSTSP